MYEIRIHSLKIPNYGLERKLSMRLSNVPAAVSVTSLNRVYPVTRYRGYSSAILRT